MNGINKKPGGSDGEHSRSEHEDGNPSPLSRVIAEAIPAFIQEYQSNNEEQCRRDRKRYRVEVATLAAVVIYAGIAALQWSQMIRANHLTEKAVEAATKSADAAVQSVTAAQSAAKSASDSVRASIESFQVDQRPYLVAGKPVFAEQPSPNRPVLVNMTLTNLGKTEAIRIRHHRALWLVAGGDTPIKTRDLIDTRFNRTREQIKNYPAFARHDISPHADLFTTATLGDAEKFTNSPNPISGPDFERLKLGTVALLLVGGVLYGDRFGQEHETEYCHYFGGPNFTAWNFCPIHNVTR